MSMHQSKLFDLIAPFYVLFFNYQIKSYEKVIDKVRDKVGMDFSDYKNVLDVGCGTGALCKLLNNKGLTVTGIDASKQMLKKAEKKLEGQNVKLLHVDALEGIPFNDKSFDIVIASHVMHGMEQEKRKIIYKEMQRIAKEMVVIYDYNQSRSIAVDIVEFFEGGDYFNFIKNAHTEMAEIFSEVKIINVASHSSWYICVP